MEAGRRYFHLLVPAAVVGVKLMVAGGNPMILRGLNMLAVGKNLPLRVCGGAKGDGEGRAAVGEMGMTRGQGERPWGQLSTSYGASLA